MDYRYLNNPFLYKVEARIAYIKKEEAFAILPDDKCHSLQQARSSLEWPEWEQAILLELAQLKHMGTWKLVDRP